MKRFFCYSDPGHSWTKVPLSLLKELGIAQEISSFSYENKGHVFLEEDRDFGIFFEAYKLQNPNVSVDNLLKCNHSNRSSKIRNFPRYNWTKI